MITRKNLTVITNCKVTQIQFDGRRAIGIVAKHLGRIKIL